MLIEFKVTNFRSIREEQTLSLVASNSEKNLPDCVIDRDLPGLAHVKFLKGAAIYGANASGKSNVITAIRFLVNFVRDSATKLQPGDSTHTQPFKLDQTSIHEPSKFELSFVADEIRYLFGLSLTTQQVTEEYLVAYPKGLPQRWYHRTYDEQERTYTWSKPSTGIKQDKSLEEKTRNNSLFLSVAAQFNHPQLTDVFNWFQSSVRFNEVGGQNVFREQVTARLLKEPGYHLQIVKLLQNSDTGICDAKIEEKEMSFDEALQYIDSRVLKNEIINTIYPHVLKNEKINTFGIKVTLLHRSEEISTMALDFHNEESLGTKRFFAIIGPWIKILENGYTVFVDEIETSLHPFLVRELLRLLFSEKNNPKGAQVIFTTHNPILLDNNLMRRDQIWFTEKSPAGSTHLYPLTDYKPRKDEALAKGYLAGRYGGIPFIPEGLKYEPKATISTETIGPHTP
jgi:uncharacterized protein